MRSSLNFNHLEVFYSVAKQLSFSKASKELSIAQPAVSKQIKQLEDDLGTTLFIRHGRSIQLTRDGKELLNSSYGKYQDLIGSIDVFKDGRNSIEGEFVLGCLQEVGERLLFPIIKRVVKKYPLLKLDIRYLKTFEILDGIHHGEIDMGIVAKDTSQENIRSYKVLEERIMLVASNKTTNGLADLSDYPIVKYRKEDLLLNAYQQFAYPRIKKANLNYLISVNSHKSMIDILKDQECIAVLPELSIKKDLEAGRLVNVGKKTFSTNLYLSYLDFNHKDARLKAIREFLQIEIKKLNY